jgi:hypothetical protein
MGYMNQHFVVYVRFEVNHDLFPTLEILSSDDPYDYAIMSPDYKWHYYVRDKKGRFQHVTMTGKEIK